jgi:hypothetical protein
LANAVAEYNDDLQEIEDGFVNRTNNQQDVNDAFNDDEPEALACAHVVVIDDIDDAVGDDFVVVDNTGAVQALDSSVDDLIAPSINEEVPVPIVPSPIDTPSDTSPIATSSDKDVAVPIIPSPIDTPSPIATFSDKDLAGRHEAQDKITAVFAVAMDVIDIKFTGRPHTINNVIEYVSALIFKVSTINIHSAQQLYLAVKDGHQAINSKLSQAGHSNLKINTSSLLRKESLKSSNFTDNQSVCAYNNTIAMIGEDDKVNFDDHSGIRVIISATATLQSCHVPMCWTNNVTTKIIGSGIRSVARLREVIQNETLNIIISKRGKPKFNKVTIIGINSTLKSDSHQGRF